MNTLNQKLYPRRQKCLINSNQAFQSNFQFTGNTRQRNKLKNNQEKPDISARNREDGTKEGGHLTLQDTGDHEELVPGTLRAARVYEGPGGRQYGAGFSGCDAMLRAQETVVLRHVCNGAVS